MRLTHHTRSSCKAGGQRQHACAEAGTAAGQPSPEVGAWGLKACQPHLEPGRGTSCLQGKVWCLSPGVPVSSGLVNTQNAGAAF